MSGSSNRSARVVIMDDVDWSEPAPRRRAADDVDPPQRTRSQEARVSVRAATQTTFAEPDLIEYDEPLDEEDVWGPRPKLMAAGAGGRRTVVITGRVADRHMAPRAAARDREGLPVHARHGFQADRTAMWAVLLCVMLLLVAITSAH